MDQLTTLQNQVIAHRKILAMLILALGPEGKATLEEMIVSALDKGAGTKEQRIELEMIMKEASQT